MTVYYKKTETGDDASATAPTDAGTYEASVTLPLSGDSRVATITYEIRKRAITITTKDQAIIYSDPIQTGLDQVTVTSQEGEALAAGDTLTGITLTKSTENVPGGTVDPSNAVIQNSAAKDVSANYDITYTSGSLTIHEKAMYAEVSGYTADYDGGAHTITVNPSESDATVKYGTAEGAYDQDAAPAYTNVGTYTVYYQVTKPNYTTVTGSETVTINPVAVNVTVGNDEEAYTGSPITPEVVVIPEAGKVVEGESLVLGRDYTVSYSDNNTNVGTVTVTISSVAGSNYSVSGTGSFPIVQATNEWLVEPSISDWTYGEYANTPSYEAKFGAVSVWYSGTANDGSDWDDDAAPTKAGRYTATFTVTGNENYTALRKDVPFTIAKADYDMSAAAWDYTEAFAYDGLEKTVEVQGLPTGVTVSGYTGNTATVVGNYTAKVTLSYDSNNYNEPVVNDLNWKIENNWTPAEYTVSAPNDNGWLNNDFVITAEDGYKVSLTNTADGTWEDALTYSAETADGSVTFFLKNETDGTISLAKTVSYKVDKTAPTGKVEFVERTGWESFVNTITFGLFYKDEVTVKVTDKDNLSGVAKMEYASSNEAKSLDEVKEIADWTEYNGSFGVTLEDARKFVYFVRITDKAGNVTYLSTDGAEYDITVPVISGIENGKTYYTTQKVTITDKNIDTITLNNETANSNIILDGNKEATYTVVATDKAGNKTTVTVTMKPISDLSAPIDGITGENVKSTDKDTLQGVADYVEELLSDDDLTDEEKSALEEIKGKADKLIEKIKKAASPATGDDSNILLHGAVLTVSLAALAVLFLVSKKRKQENA